MQTALRSMVLDPAVSYLCENYNESLHLISETPNDHLKDNIYWIYSDNYLASLVLQEYDRNNLTQTKMARNITIKMQDCFDNYISETSKPMNQYMVLNQSSMLSERGFEFHAAKAFTLNTTADGAAINTTANNQSGLLDPMEYADIAFLNAIYCHELGREADAMTAYLNGIIQYDGKGFNDTPFKNHPRHYYQTYKLALYIYASELLEQDYDILAFYTLLAMQQPKGGFATEYDSGLNATGGTNTETTSLAIWSLMSISPTPIPEFGTIPLVVVVFLMMAVLMRGAGRRKAL